MLNKYFTIKWDKRKLHFLFI